MPPFFFGGQVGGGGGGGDWDRAGRERGSEMGGRPSPLSSHHPSPFSMPASAAAWPFFSSFFLLPSILWAGRQGCTASVAGSLSSPPLGD